MLVTMGLAWLGGETSIHKLISGMVMGGLFIFLGHSLVARGRSLPICTTSRGLETTRNDQIAARRMIVQAVWIGAFIVLAVGLVVGLLLFLASKSTGCPAERATAVSRSEEKADRVILSPLPESPSLCLSRASRCRELHSSNIIILFCGG